MGVGVSVYFKFLKYMTFTFLWFTILSLPAYFLYFNGNESKKEQKSISTYFSSFTLGNIGEGKLSTIINYS